MLFHWIDHAWGVFFLGVLFGMFLSSLLRGFK